MGRGCALLLFSLGLVVGSPLLAQDNSATQCLHTYCASQVQACADPTASDCADALDCIGHCTDSKSAWKCIKKHIDPTKGDASQQMTALASCGGVHKCWNANEPPSPSPPPPSPSGGRRRRRRKEEEEGVKPARDASVVATRYSQWAAEHGREEDPSRLETFATNLAFIEAHDEATAGYTLALNAFADLTVSEFVSVAFGGANQLPDRDVATLALNDTQAVDWRTRGKVNAVHDAMASGCSIPDVMADTVASAEAIKCAGASLQELSTTQLIECAAGSMGCSGFTSTFEEYVVKSGILTSEDYAKLPGTPGTCRLNGTSTSSDLKCKVTKWVAVTPNDSEQLQAAVNEQPVVVLVNAASSAFQFYRSGILAGDCPSTPLDHAMVVVGYSSLQGKDMWIVKNDWGEQWGDGGYISIARDSGKGPGQCGIASSPAYPKLQ